jgi:predicted  nucleic acid-binding Zn-ribbon protein
MIALYRTVERLEEHCFLMQQELRRINHELFGLQEHCFAMQNDLRGVQQEIRKLNHELFVLQKQSSHASEPSPQPGVV